MSNRIIGLNGQPAPEPKKENVREMIEDARLMYDAADKRKAFHRLCDAMHLLSLGVARSFKDNERLRVELIDIRERITPK